MICLTLNTMSRAAAAELGDNRKLLAASPENEMVSHHTQTWGWGIDLAWIHKTIDYRNH